MFVCFYVLYLAGGADVPDERNEEIFTADLRLTQPLKHIQKHI